MHVTNGFVFQGVRENALLIPFQVLLNIIKLDDSFMTSGFEVLQEDRF